MPLIPLLKAYSKDYRITLQEGQEIIEGMIKSAIIVMVVSTSIKIAVRNLDLCEHTAESLEMIGKLR